MGCGGLLGVIILIAIAIPFLRGFLGAKDEDRSRIPTTSYTSTVTSTTTIESEADQATSNVTTEVQTQSTEQTRPVVNGFVIGDKKGEVDQYGNCTVTGVIGNATGRDCNYVAITIGFYAENGTKITSGIDNVLNLKKGETWQYTVYGFGNNISNFKVEEVDWY